jgi:hypothetical protein
VAAATTLGATVAVSPAAQATTTVTSNCSTTKWACLYYNSVAYGYGAEFGANASIYSFNYTTNGGIYYNFKAGSRGSNGAGWSIWNNAASAQNIGAPIPFCVYQNSGYDGKVDMIMPWQLKNLVNTKNDDASLLIMPGNCERPY